MMTLKHFLFKQVRMHYENNTDRDVSFVVSLCDVQIWYAFPYALAYQNQSKAEARL